jgi:hypothetical protein
MCWWKYRQDHAGVYKTVLCLTYSLYSSC